MFLGRTAVAKEILVPDMNIARLGMRELLTFFLVAMVKMFIMATVIEAVLPTNGHCPNWLF